MEDQEDAKKRRDREKKKLRDKSKKVDELCSGKEYEKCLKYISTIDGNAMRNFKIYESAILCNVQTERYEEALALIGLHKAHGHSDKSVSTLFREAVCYFYLSNHEDAYRLFTDLLGHKDIDDETRECCIDSIKEIIELDPKIVESVNRKAEQLIKEVEAEQLIKEIEAEKPSSSSTSSSSTSKLDRPSSTSTSKLDPPSSTSKVDSPVGVVESNPLVAVSSSVACSPSSSQKTAACSPEPSSVACSPITVASSSQKTAELESLVLSENMSFKMDELDKQSYTCLMQNGLLQPFQKTLIIQGEMKMKCLDESTSKDPFKMKGGPFLLKSEFLVHSSSLLRNLYVVEPVLPIQVFFKRKLNDFNGNNEEQWWEFINKWFQTIFRGILCGLFAIHSAKMTCGDLDSSMYVTNDGQGRIFYVSGESFSESQAQKDFDDLLSTMEAVVTLIKPRARTELEAWIKEFEDSYKLPLELRYFFVSLRDKKVANHRIQTTWLIDHPFFWPFEHKSYFIRILHDVFRQELINESMFTSYFNLHSELKGWKSRVSNDNLLSAIYAYKGDARYNSGSEAQIIHFILAVLNHANDHNYSHHRGQTKLTPVDIALKITSVFPTIYTIIYDAMCSYANDIQNRQAFEEFDLLWQALERCSSL